MKSFCAAHRTTTCTSTGIGLYWFCLNISMMRLPRSSSACVFASRSEPNCANAASSRNCARSPLIRPATCFMRLDLRGGTDARNGQADGHGGTHALIEQIRFQINLPVGNRNHVRRDVSRNVAGLRFDDRQRRERAVAVFFADTRAAFQQAAVQIKHVAGIRFAAGRTFQDQRHLAIGDRVLGQDHRK